MKAISPFLFLLIFSCTSVPSDDVPNIVNTTTESDTLYTDAIKEAQDIPEDSSACQVQTDQAISNLGSDFSWVKGESELFSISLEGSELVFWSDSLKKVEISYKLETSMTIMDEGPHCDLTDWVHGSTSWTEMDPVEGYELTELKYTRFKFSQNTWRTDSLPFPETDMNVAREAILIHCGERWFEHAKSCKSPYDYPCEIGISTYIFRVKFKIDDQGDDIYEFLKIPVSMGC